VSDITPSILSFFFSYLNFNSKKEFEDLRKLHRVTFRAAAASLARKKKEIVAKDEAKYQMAFENEQRSKRELEELQAQKAVIYQKVLKRRFIRIIDLISENTISILT
jgi:hypothetical protein